MTKRADKWLRVKLDVTPFFCHTFKLWDENDPQVVCVDPVMWVSTVIIKDCFVICTVMQL